MEREQHANLDLDGWPVVSIPIDSARHVTLEEFRELILGDDGEAGVYAVETAPGGSVAARRIKQPPPESLACRIFFDAYFSSSLFTWEPEYLILFHEPCYLAVRSGVILQADGSIVLETLYPSIGGETLKFHLDIAAGDLAVQIRNAPELESGVWAPLYSRWSEVYGHALAESLVQDSAFYHAGLSPLLCYAATASPVDAQRILLDQVHSRIVKFSAPLIKVSKAIIATKMYRYMPLGHELKRCMTWTRERIAGSSELARRPAAKKIYVSRLGVPVRPMTNEAALIDRISKMGFQIVAGQTLSFEDQVRSFRDAELIVGPFGSGLINSAFAASDARVCELHPLNSKLESPSLDPFYLQLAATMGFPFAVYVSENPDDTDEWECNISEVVDLVSAISATDVD